MTPEQKAFLQMLAQRIPRLFQAIRDGNQRAEFVLGSRILNGRQVRLVLVAEVVDPGANPLATHSTGRDSEALRLTVSLVTQTEEGLDS